MDGKKLETSVEILTHEIPISRVSYNFNLRCLLAAKLNVINSQLLLFYNDVKLIDGGYTNLGCTVLGIYFLGSFALIIINF